MTAAKIAVFDSGLGGLTVYRELKSQLPGARYVYFADNAAFPYGDWREDELVERILTLFAGLIEREAPDVCVIACNTASTIALEPLRQQFDVPFVGTVPAIKVAGQQSKTRLFSVLATPGTVRRDYTRELIDRFGGGCKVRLVAAAGLARLAEEYMRGRQVDDAALLQEIEPAFFSEDGRRSDQLVLGCTHFPLLQKHMEIVAPWPVTYIDPAAAIARQTSVVLQQVEKMVLTDDCFESDEMLSNKLIFTDFSGVDAGLGGFLNDAGLRQPAIAEWAPELRRLKQF